jgi:hypothetical protein
MDSDDSLSLFCAVPEEREEKRRGSDEVDDEFAAIASRGVDELKLRADNDVDDDLNLIDVNIEEV